MSAQFISPIFLASFQMLNLLTVFKEELVFLSLGIRKSQKYHIYKAEQLNKNTIL